MKEKDEDDLDFSKEFILDAEEAAESELKDLIDATSGQINSAVGSLEKKLVLVPDGAFKISDFSEYRDDTWLLEKPTYCLAVKVSFNSDIFGCNSLKKALSFYVLPDNSPFGTLKSFSTSKGRADDFRLLEIYIFKANSLSASEDDIGLITPKMLNQALENSKNNGSNRHYHSLFSIIKLWLALSQQQLIPSEHRLTVNPMKVDTIGRRRDVVAHFTGTMQTWLPFSEPDIEKLTNYALFWVDEALPALLKVKDYILEYHLDSKDRCIVYRDEQDSELEETLSVIVGKTQLISFSRSLARANARRNCFRYTWVDSYARALDKIRNAVFVLISLITGMRARELTGLTVDSLWKDAKGDYWINVRRFKASHDPNYQGEIEAIPLPHYVAKKAIEYLSLKDVYDFKKQGFIFQSNKSRKKLNKATTAQLRGITAELMEDTGVDRIHPHRFRKTIAEIIINRSERNIELIRLLFGHRSYTMSLAYIARNPYLVRGVAQLLEESFTLEFMEIVSAVRKGSYSGIGAERIASTLANRPGDFTGRQFKITVLRYIAHLLAAGEPLFIQRTALGIYCVMCEEITKNNLPPCLSGRTNDFGLFPDPTHCQIECRFAVVVENAKQAIKDNVTFYLALLDGEGDESLKPAAAKSIRLKIAANERHLLNLERGAGQHVISPTRSVGLEP